MESSWRWCVTRSYGDILIIKSQNTYHAMRKSDGSDAWTVPFNPPRRRNSPMIRC